MKRALLTIGVPAYVVCSNETIQWMWRTVYDHAHNYHDISTHGYVVFQPFS